MPQLYAHANSPTYLGARNSMGSSYFTNPVEFLINVVFGFYILAVMVRFLMQLTRADFRNPLAQALVKLTNPPLVPLRRIFPGTGGVDVASIVLMIALQLTSLLLIQLIKGGPILIVALTVLSFAYLLDLLINVFIYSILILVVVSWINPGSYNPVLSMLSTMTEPVMRPARRLIKPIGGLDLTPMIAMVALYVFRMLALPPIEALARSISF